MKLQNRSLLWIVSTRILALSLTAVLIQAGFVFVHYWSDNSRLARSLVADEVDALRAGLSVRGGVITFSLPRELAGRYGAHKVEGQTIEQIPSGYYAKVTNSNGDILFSTCDGSCRDLLFPIGANLLPRWQKVLTDGKPIVATGGRVVDVGSTGWADIAVAVIRDPEGLIWTAIGRELIDHMLIPMLDMLVIVVLATIFFIWAALKPTTEAVRQIESMNFQSVYQPLAFARMPREVASLVRAMNHAFARVHELLRDQQLFSAAVSHELRTPIAVARLHLEGLDDPRAREAVEDLDDLAHVVEQLTQLARLEEIAATSFKDIDLSKVVQSTVSRLAPYVYSKSHSLEFVDMGSGSVRAVPGLVEILVSNLIENAVKHTPRDSHIQVQVGPGPSLRVNDNYPFGLPPNKDSGVDARRAAPARSGFGLRIVNRVAAIHGASFSIATTPETGTSATVSFNA